MDIVFRPPKHLNDKYIQLAATEKGNRKIYKIDKAKCYSKIYKKNNKYYIDIELKNTEHETFIKNIDKIKQYAIEYVYQTKTDTKKIKREEIEKSFIDINKKKGKHYYTFEVHPNCKFLKSNYKTLSRDKPENVTTKDIIDFVVVFTAIIFDQYSLTCKWAIHQIKRFYVQELNVEDLNSDVYDDLEYDEKKYVSKYDDKFKNIQ